MAKKQPATPATPPGGAASEKEVEYRYVLRFFLVSRLTTALLALVIGLCAVGFAYVAIYLPVSVSAGQETTISVAMNWLSSFGADSGVAYLVAASGVGFGVWQWRARVSERKTAKGRVTELEAEVRAKRENENEGGEG